MKHLEHTLETYVYSHYNMCNILFYFCNIDIQHLQHTSETFETLWNIFLQHALVRRRQWPNVHPSVGAGLPFLPAREVDGGTGAGLPRRRCMPPCLPFRDGARWMEAARDGGADCGAVRDGARVRRRRCEEGRGERVGCLRRAALCCCTGEDERFFLWRYGGGVRTRSESSERNTGAGRPKGRTLASYHYRFEKSGYKPDQGKNWIRKKYYEK
jgi:hypothetical protein